MKTVGIFRHVVRAVHLNISWKHCESFDYIVNKNGLSFKIRSYCSKRITCLVLLDPFLSKSICASQHLNNSNKDGVAF